MHSLPIWLVLKQIWLQLKHFRSVLLPLSSEKSGCVTRLVAFSQIQVQFEVRVCSATIRFYLSTSVDNVVIWAAVDVTWAAFEIYAGLNPFFAITTQVKRVIQCSHSIGPFVRLLGENVVNRNGFFPFPRCILRHDKNAVTSELIKIYNVPTVIW